MTTEKEIIKKEYNEMNLGQLVYEINSRFKVHKKQKYSIIMWSLVCWQSGYWNVSVTDSWHKWLDKGIKKLDMQYLTPEMACREFLKYIDVNKIDIKKLQER